MASAATETARSDGSTSVNTVAIRLSNRNSRYGLPDELLAGTGSTTSSRLLIPQDWKRFQLSELVNRLVGTERPTPFDFIINEQPLGGYDLETFLKETGTSAEAVLQVDYSEIARPPSPHQDYIHDDWISSIDARGRHGTYLTGSYDGVVRVWSSSSPDKARFEARAGTGPVLVARWLAPSIYAPEWRMVAAGRTGDIVILTEVDASAKSAAQSSRMALKYHEQTVSAVSLSNEKGTGLLSGSWDGGIALWTTEKPRSKLANGTSVNGSVRAKKRRKGLDDEAIFEPSALVKSSAATLQGHTGAVTSLLASQADFCSDQAIPDTVFSTSHDSTVRSWNVETGVATTVRHSDRVPLAADLVRSGSGNQIVVGNSDRSITLHDLRTSSGTNDQTSMVTLNVPLAHSSEVSCVRTGTSQAGEGVHTVISAGYDGIIKAWDIRAIRATTANDMKRQVRPLWSMAVASGKSQETSVVPKILALDWTSLDGQDTILAGGESKVLHTSKRVT